jgi:two-component system cell cycle sensor histidine kinase/response regulator CckA
MSKQDLFRLAFEEAAIGIAVVAAEPLGQYIEVNPAFCRITGYSREELLSRNFQSITVSEDLNKTLQQVRALLSGPVSTLQTEKRYLRKDGHALWARLNVSLIRDPRERPLYFIVQVEDIDTHRRSEEVSRETHQTLAALVEASPLAIITLDMDRKVKMWNPAAERLFGWTPEEVLGRPNPIVPEDKQEEFRKYIQSLLQGPQFADFHLRRQRKDGSLIDVNLSTTLLRDAQGNINGFMGIFVDLTERLRLEEQLRHAHKLEAVGQLAGGVAHEFNNLLTAIIGNIDLSLMEVSPHSNLRTMLDRVQQAAHRATALTHQLLTFSRRRPMDLKPIYLSQIAQEVLRLLRQTIDRRIDLKVEGEDFLPVLADAGQIHQVVMNLCVNARDALTERFEKVGPEGEKKGWMPRITIRTENAWIDAAYCRSHPNAKPGRYVCLTVEDNGCGIDPKDQSRIFDPFFTTKEVGQGTGLGLAAVYGIVQQHQGWIEVNSIPGQGSVFKVYFSPTGLSEIKTGEQSDEMVSDGTETILLVDDEESIRELGRTILELHGYTVLLAEDGIRGIEVLNQQRERISLVILDIMMPRRSGWEVLEEIRALSPRMKVIISSGYDLAGQRKDASVEFLAKPYSPDELARRVRKALDRLS